MEDDDTLIDFENKLGAWRQQNPDATLQEQMRYFPPIKLWMLAGGQLRGPYRNPDRNLYESLMAVAGYSI